MEALSLPIITFALVVAVIWGCLPMGRGAVEDQPAEDDQAEGTHRKASHPTSAFPQSHPTRRDKRGKRS